MAVNFYSAMGSETLRLAAVKKQIPIQYLGLGVGGVAHNACSKGGITLSLE